VTRRGFAARAPEPAADAPCWVVHVEPAPGERLVLRDTPVLLRLSRPADAASVSPDTVRVVDPAGPVPCDVKLSGDGQVVIWRARRPLLAGVPHVVRATGLRDGRGRPVEEHESAFVPCGLGREDLAGG
jgi:hypothetical protein